MKTTLEYIKYKFKRNTNKKTMAIVALYLRKVFNVALVNFSQMLFILKKVH